MNVCYRNGNTSRPKSYHGKEPIRRINLVNKGTDRSQYRSNQVEEPKEEQCCVNGYNRQSCVKRRIEPCHHIEGTIRSLHWKEQPDGWREPKRSHYGSNQGCEHFVSISIPDIEEATRRATCQDAQKQTIGTFQEVKEERTLSSEEPKKKPTKKQPDGGTKRIKHRRAQVKESQAVRGVQVKRTKEANCSTNQTQRGLKDDQPCYFMMKQVK